MLIIDKLLVPSSTRGRVWATAIKLMFGCPELPHNHFTAVYEVEFWAEAFRTNL